MKLQIAIDRVSIDTAILIIEQTKDYVDIIEVGTSLIKDYGMEAIRKIRKTFPNIIILADIKTIDEAEYEFEAIYNVGADIATVMGAASLNTIRICQKVAKKHNKQYVIDLLEVNDLKLEQLKEFEDAIFAIHLPSDNNIANNHLNLERLVNKTVNKLNSKSIKAVAGGVKLNNLKLFNQLAIDIVIVGGAITKSDNIRNTAKQFYELKGD